jgi:maleate isomerase
VTGAAGSTPSLGDGIDYGDRLRLGVVVPSGNVIAEPQLAAMLPAGVAPYVTRLPLRGSSDAELAAMLDGLEPATRLLADARVDLMVFHCTAVSTSSPALGAGIASQMTAVSGIPATSTGDALVAALRALSARRVVLLSPYLEGPHRREVEFLTWHGFDVVADAALGIDTNAEMATLHPRELFDFALGHRHPDADAYLVSCTALRSAEIIEPLEAELGRPVVTSNQAMAWHALRLGGVEDPVDGYGVLLRTSGTGPSGDTRAV